MAARLRLIQKRLDHNFISRDHPPPNRGDSVRINWKRLDPKQIEEYCKEYEKRWHDYPSVRDLFYRFVDELWANTKSAYKGLSKWLVKKRLSDEIFWGYVRDGGGRETTIGDYPFVDPDRWLKYNLEKLMETADVYHIPRWHNQEKQLVVVCEKEADFPPLKHIANSLYVPVMYTRGYSGWRPWFELVERLRENEKPTVIIAIGDFDPSGEDIVRFCEDALKTLGLEVEVDKVVVTKEQVEKYDLPHRPEDAEEIAKIRRDPRFKTWTHGLYRVETAAFRARAPDAFQEVIENAIKKHSNDEIFEETKKLDEKLRKQLKEKLEDLFEEIEE